MKKLASNVPITLPTTKKGSLWKNPENGEIWIYTGEKWILFESGDGFDTVVDPNEEIDAYNYDRAMRGI